MAMAKNPLITKNRFKNLFPCRESDLNKRKKDFSNAPFREREENYSKKMFHMLSLLCPASSKWKNELKKIENSNIFFGKMTNDVCEAFPHSKKSVW